MKVWIDLDNSPHVLFFVPIIRALERDGMEVLVTARDFSQTQELAMAQGLDFETIGEHRTHHHFATRVVGTVRRAGQLANYVRKKRPDVAISHGSRGLVLAAWMLGIPSMTLYDYEFISSRVFNQLSSRILAPSVVNPETLRQRGLDLHKFTPYPGLKEEVYVYDLPHLVLRRGFQRGRYHGSRGRVVGCRRIQHFCGEAWECGPGLGLKRKAEID